MIKQSSRVMVAYALIRASSETPILTRVDLHSDLQLLTRCTPWQSLRTKRGTYSATDGNESSSPAEKFPYGLSLAQVRIRRWLRVVSQSFLGTLPAERNFYQPPLPFYSDYPL